MNINVLFLSPRYIKYEYFGALISSLDVRHVFSFLPMGSMHYSISGPLMRYPCRELAARSVTEYYESVGIIAGTLAEMACRVTDAVLPPNKGNINNPYVIVVADWELWSYAYRPYDEILSATGTYFQRWSHPSSDDVFPFTNAFGDLAQDIVSAYESANKAADRHERVNFCKVSVFFSPADGLSLSYDASRGGWYPAYYVGRASHRRFGTVMMLIQNAARKHESLMTGVMSNGRRGVKKVTLKVADIDAGRWREYQSWKERQWANAQDDMEREAREDLIRDGIEEAFNGDMSNVWNID